MCTYIYIYIYIIYIIYIYIYIYIYVYIYIYMCTMARGISGRQCSPMAGHPCLTVIPGPLKTALRVSDPKITNFSPRALEIPPKSSAKALLGESCSSAYKHRVTLRKPAYACTDYSLR